MVLIYAISFTVMAVLFAIAPEGEETNEGFKLKENQK